MNTDRKKGELRSPYRGLQSFRYVDQACFFGREKTIDELLVKVLISRLVVLFGESGAGKSSLINAGLIPGLENEGLRPERLRIRPIPNEPIWIEKIPKGEDESGPFLSSIFFDNNAIERDTEERFIPCSLERFIDAIRETNARSVLIFDQFEELFAQFAQQESKFEEEEALQNKILEQIVHIVNDKSLKVRVIIVIREDFLGKLEILAEDYPKIFDNRVRLQHLDQDSAKKAIVKPFEKKNPYPSCLRTDLANEIVKKLAHERENAPIRSIELQIVCSHLWDKYASKRSEITLSEFKMEGGVEGIIKGFLESELAGIRPPALMPKAIIVLCNLITESGTRDVVIKDRLTGLATFEKDTGKEELSSILTYLEERRLVYGTVRRETYFYELANEYLISPIQKEKRLLEIKRERAEAEKKAEEQAKIARRFRWLSAALAVVVVVAIAAAVYAYCQAKVAERQRQIALAHRLTAQAELTRHQDSRLLQRSVLLAVESMRRFQSYEADQALRHGLALLPRPFGRLSHKGPVVSVAFSPDAKYLATASYDNTARVWEVTSGQEVVRLNHEDRVGSVAFSPDGKYLATTSDDNNARIWEVTSGQEVMRMYHEEKVVSVAFSPDGKYLATASYDHIVRVWEPTTGKEVERVKHEDWVSSVAFSPDGKYLATASYDKTARIWKLATGEQISRMNHKALVFSVTFSPDGKHLATASYDSTARVWEVTSGQEVVRINHDGPVFSVAFSPDGKHLATASRDKSAWVWEKTRGQEVTRMSHEDEVVSVAFSPDGKYLATSSKDNTARLWPLWPEDLIAEASSRLTRNLTYQEWQRYFADEPYCKTCPNLAIHPSFFEAGRDLAIAGNVEGAVAIFRRALILEPSLDIDPEVEAGQVLIRKGRDLAAEGNFRGAITQFQKALELNPGLDIDPKAEAGRLAAEGLTWKGRDLAAEGDLDGAIAQYQKAIELNPGLNIDPKAEAGRLAAEGLIRKGRISAMEGDLEGAAAQFQKALELNPGLGIDPNAEAGRLAAEGLITKGRDLAMQGDLEGATTQFQKATELNPGLDIDPKTEAGRLAGEFLIRKGRISAMEGDFESAIAQFQKALELNPGLDIDPIVEARRFAAQGLVDRGMRYAIQGKIKEAIIAFEKAQTQDPIFEISADSWNALGWFGCLWGHAADVMYACEKAVELEPENGNIRDTRGLVRALTGDSAGAIEDFQFYIKWGQDKIGHEELLPKRQVWIRELEAGRNPFDAATLETLRKEY